jgi:N-acetylmuramoyl-L-alanine amidase
MKIMIDPGHGGADNGAAYGYAEEDDIALIVAFLLRCELEKEGHKVLMTRERDVFVSLSDRCMMANQAGADLFVSVHCDAWHKETTSGISTHIYTGAGSITDGIARLIHIALTERFPDHNNRGVKLSNFCVLRNTIMPALLIECEFISNPETRKFLREPENQLAIARAITRGVSSWI